MYVCRGQDGGSLVPGKWVKGNCNVAFNGREDVLRQYEVAFGSAQWGSYQGNFQGLVRTGRDVDGSPLYSCRVRASGQFDMQDLGWQPGKLLRDGTCHYAMGGQEVTANPPFDVLFGAGGNRPDRPYPPPPASLPYCRLVDSGVVLNGDGQWVGPNCAPSDGLGHPPRGQQNASSLSQAPAGPYEPGPSSVTWQAAQSPFQPGEGAVMGGPGNGPKPGAPLWVCRAYLNGALLPGKWIEGQCSVSYAGREQKLSSYFVAMGPARWQTFDGNVSALVPGGYDVDNTPQYICRLHLKMLGDKGLQPGRMAGGQCLVPYAGMEQNSGMPFEALYNEFPAGAAAAGGSAPPPPSDAAAQGIQVHFVSGTADAAGSVTVTNGASGKTVSKPLPPHFSPEQCVLVLQQAAFEAGMQIQATDTGSGLRIFGSSSTVNVTGASASVGPF